MVKELNSRQFSKFLKLFNVLHTSTLKYLLKVRDDCHF